MLSVKHTSNRVVGPEDWELDGKYTKEVKLFGLTLYKLESNNNNDISQWTKEGSNSKVGFKGGKKE